MVVVPTLNTLELETVFSFSDTKTVPFLVYPTQLVHNVVLDPGWGRREYGLCIYIYLNFSVFASGNSFVSASLLPSLLAIFQIHIWHHFWHPPLRTWVFNGVQLACHLVISEPMRAKMNIYHYKTTISLMTKMMQVLHSLLFYFFIGRIAVVRAQKEGEKAHWSSILTISSKSTIFLFGDNLFPTSCVTQSTCKQDKLNTEEFV